MVTGRRASSGAVQTLDLGAGRGCTVFYVFLIAGTIKPKGQAAKRDKAGPIQKRQVCCCILHNSSIVN